MPMVCCHMRDYLWHNDYGKIRDFLNRRLHCYAVELADGP